jgi:hypothetical protein
MTTPEASIGSLDILADLSVTRPTARCRIQTMREERPDLYEQWLRVKDSKHVNDRVARWFADRQFPLSSGSVRLHRRNECSACQTTS